MAIGHARDLDMADTLAPGQKNPPDITVHDLGMVAIHLHGHVGFVEHGRERVGDLVGCPVVQKQTRDGFGDLARLDNRLVA